MKIKIIAGTQTQKLAKISENISILIKFMQPEHFLNQF